MDGKPPEGGLLTVGPTDPQVAKSSLVLSSSSLNERPVCFIEMRARIAGTQSSLLTILNKRLPGWSVTLHLSSISSQETEVLAPPFLHTYLTNCAGPLGKLLFQPGGYDAEYPADCFVQVGIGDTRHPTPLCFADQIFLEIPYRRKVFQVLRCPT